jgi:hypothetical protein
MYGDDRTAAVSDPFAQACRYGLWIVRLPKLACDSMPGEQLVDGGGCGHAWFVGLGPPLDGR